MRILEIEYSATIAFTDYQPKKLGVKVAITDEESNNLSDTIASIVNGVHNDLKDAQKKADALVYGEPGGEVTPRETRSLKAPETSSKETKGKKADKASKTAPKAAKPAKTAPKAADKAPVESPPPIPEDAKKVQESVESKDVAPDLKADVPEAKLTTSAGADANDPKVLMKARAEFAKEFGKQTSLMDGEMKKRVLKEVAGIEGHHMIFQMPLDKVEHAMAGLPKVVKRLSK